MLRGMTTPDPSKKYRLKKLRVREASLVKRGANPGARKLFWKDEDGDTPDKVEAVASLVAAAEVAKAAGASLEDVDTIMDKLYPSNDAGDGSPDNPAEGDGGNMSVKKDDPKAGEGKDTKVEGVKADPIVKADDAKAKVEKMSTCPKCGHEYEPGAEKPMEKAFELPASVRKELDDNKALATSLAKELADQKRTALTKEVHTFVESLTLPGVEMPKVETLLLKLHEAGHAELAKEMESVLGATAAVAKDSVAILSKENGFTGGSEKANSAVAKMNKLAKDRATTEKVSFAKAYDAVFAENAALALEVLKEEKAPA